MNAFGPLCGIVWPTCETINHRNARATPGAGRSVAWKTRRPPHHSDVIVQPSFFPVGPVGRK